MIDDRRRFPRILEDSTNDARKPTDDSYVNVAARFELIRDADWTRFSAAYQHGGHASAPHFALMH